MNDLRMAIFSEEFRDYSKKNHKYVRVLLDKPRICSRFTWKTTNMFTFYLINHEYVHVLLDKP